MGGKGFLSTLKALDAQRLQKSVKATVQNSGRLTFAMDAVKDMKLSEEKSIIILAAENGDLGAAISVKGDPNAFALKKCGAYFYVTFKNYLQQAGIDYKTQRVVYDITELDEEYKPGMPLYKFERRFLPKGSKEDTEAEVENQADGKETPPAAPESPATPSEVGNGADVAIGEQEVVEAVPAAQGETPSASDKNLATDAISSDSPTM